MDNIDTSQISDPNVEQPFLGTSLAFLQAATKEAISNFLIGLIGPGYSAAQVYILFGCVRSGTADGGTGAVAVTAGAVFFNGEVYTVQAFAGALAANNLGSAENTIAGAPDPVTFSDGSSKSVHNKLQWIPVVGGGANLVSGWIPYVGAKTALALLNSWTTAATAPSLRMDGLGNVYLSGNVAAPGSNAAPFVIPAGSRPKSNRTFTVFGSGGMCELVIQSNGNVLLQYIGGTQLAGAETAETNAIWNIND